MILGSVLQNENGNTELRPPAASTTSTPPSALPTSFHNAVLPSQFCFIPCSLLSTHSQGLLHPCTRLVAMMTFCSIARMLFAFRRGPCNVLFCQQFSVVTNAHVSG